MNRKKPTIFMSFLLPKIFKSRINFGNYLSFYRDHPKRMDPTNQMILVEKPGLVEKLHDICLLLNLFNFSFHFLLASKVFITFLNA
jgi:hypothetical protein